MLVDAVSIETAHFRLTVVQGTHGVPFVQVHSRNSRHSRVQAMIPVKERLNGGSERAEDQGGTQSY